MPDADNIPDQIDTLYVVFKAEIDPNTVEQLTAVLVQASQKGVKELYLGLSTPGGQVQAGIALYTTLMAMPFKLTVHNISGVSSVGNVVFLAGAERYAAPNTTFMFHGVGMDTQGPMRLQEQFLRDCLDSILADQSRMGKIIARHTSLSDDDVALLFRAQNTKSAAWAKDHGVVEDVRDFKVPSGQSVVSFVFNR